MSQKLPAHSETAPPPAGRSPAADDGDLPEGWALAKLAEVVEVLDNLRIPVNSDERATRLGTVPYFGATGQVGTIDEHLFDAELLLVGEDGAPFFDKSKPIAYVISGKSWVNNHAHVLRAIEHSSSNHFLKWYLDWFDFNGFVNGTTRLKLTQGAMNSIPLPLPPLAEQRRIVGKLEAVLGKVSASRERLARVPGLLKRFRQSVLAAACSGKLTTDWREENPREDCGPLQSRLESLRESIWCGRNKGNTRRKYRPPCTVDGVTIDLPSSWRDVTLSQLALLDVGHAFKSNEFETSGIRLLRGENLEPGRLRWTDTRYWLPEKLDGLEHLMIEDGEIVMALDRPVISTGLKIARACKADLPCVLVQRMMRFKVVDSRITPWLFYNLNLAAFIEHLSAGMTGSDIPHVTGTGVAEYVVSLPPLAEQHEIVRRVERLFALSDRLEAQLRAAQTRVDKLTQAVLAKAFRGELVPTEADLARREARPYEPAHELLARIRDQQTTTSPPKAPRKPRKKKEA